MVIDFHLPNGNKPETVMKVACSILAPKGRLPFSIFCPVTLAEGSTPEAKVVTAVPLEPKQVCWGVDDAVFKGDENAETRFVTGSVRNYRNVRVSNIEVYADVYFGDGRLAGAVKGRLEHSNMLDPSARDDFSLAFPATAVGTRMRRPVVRIVGDVP